VLLLETGLDNPGKLGFNEPQMHLGLGYIAAALKSRFTHYSYECTIFQHRGETFEEIAELSARYDVFAFTSFSCNWDATCELKQRLLAANPGRRVVTIVGGAHATGAPTDATGQFDYVVMGEGEETIIELLDTLNDGRDASDVLGVATAGGASRRAMVNPRRPRLQDLDRFGPPQRAERMWDVFPGMPPVPVGTKRFSPIVFSRGCPMNCTYCNNSNMFAGASSNRLVHIPRDPCKVVDEIEALQTEYGANTFYTHEEDLAYDTAFLERFCRELNRRHLHVRWTGMASTLAFVREGGAPSSAGRSRRMSRDRRRTLLASMREAGCYAINFGFERSPNDQEFFRDFHRQWGLIEQDQVIDDTFEAGIFPALLLMIAVPDESHTKVDWLLDYLVHKSRALRFRFSYMYPFVGTQLREDIKKQLVEVIERRFLQNKYATTEHPALAGQLPLDRLRSLSHELEKAIYLSSPYAQRLREFTVVDASQPEPLFDLDGWRQTIADYLGGETVAKGLCW
jgi:radical SAM superfamily enzyme YgiQ (UPF0313 family)